MDDVKIENMLISTTIMKYQITSNIMCNHPCATCANTATTCNSCYDGYAF